MAWDFTFSSGGRPDSGDRRSTSAADQGRTTRSSVTTKAIGEAPSVMAGTNASPLEGLASTMGEFFGGMSRIEDQKRMAEEEERNNEAIIEAQRRVWANPEKAREALRTGDYSNFIDDDELRSRKSVQDGFMKATGLTTARDLWETEGREFISSLSATDDPTAALQAWISEKTEGANPIYSNAFMNAAMKLGEPEVTKFQNARFQHMVEQATTTASNAMRAVLEQQGKNPEADFDANQVMGAAVRAFSGVPVPGPLKDQLMRQAVSEVAMQEAAKSNPAAYDYIKSQRMNPADPSSPTIEQYWEGKDQPLWKWQSRAIQADREKLASQTSADMERVTMEFATGQRSAGEVQAAMTYWVADEGVHPLNSRITEMHRMIKDNLKTTKVATRLSEFLKGNLGPSMITNEDQKEITKLLEGMNFDVRQFSQTMGINMATAQKNLFELMDNGVISDRQKLLMANSILDPTVKDDDVKNRMNFLLAFNNAGHNIRNIVPASQADEVTGMVQLYQQDPEMFRRARKGLIEAKKNNVDITDASKLYPKMSSAKLTVELGKNLPIDEMTPAARGRALLLANMMIVGLGNMEDGVAAAATMFSKENMKAVMSSSGRIAYDVKSTMGDNYSEGQLEEMNRRVKIATGDRLYTTGETTIHGGNVLADTRGAVQRYIPGFTKHHVPVDGEIPKEYKHWTVEGKDPDGRTILRPPPAPKEGESHVKALGDNLYAVWESQHNTWATVMSDTDLTKKMPDAPLTSDTATKALFPLLKRREALKQALAASGYSEPSAPPSGAVTRGRMGKGLRKVVVPEHRKIVEELAEVNNTIEKYSAHSGVNKHVAKLIEDVEKAYGSSPTLTAAKQRATNDPTPVIDSADEDDMIYWTSKVIKDDRKQRIKDDHGDITKPDQTYKMLAEPWITKTESYSSTAYADASTTSVGYGWNIEDDDIMAVLEKHGYTKAGLKSKAETIPQSVGKKILADVWRVKREQSVKAVGEEVWQSLSPKQRTGLTSLAYNALSLIGPGLKGALKRFAEAKESGDQSALESAAYLIDFEVRYRSLPIEKMIKDGNAYAIDGLNDRRNREADMLLDQHLFDANSKPKFPERYWDWRTEFKDVLKRHEKKNKRNKFDPNRKFEPRESRTKK